MTDSPTPFCVISGKLTHTLVSVEFKLGLFSYRYIRYYFPCHLHSGFLFCTTHIIHIWITVDLPNLKFTHSKVVHIMVVSSCILLSILGPIVALATAKYKYVVTRDYLDFVFFSLILSCAILVATSTSFLVLLFWTVYKVCIGVACDRIICLPFIATSVWTTWVVWTCIGLQSHAVLCNLN